MPEDLTDQKPKRSRGGHLSDRQRQALDAIRQRPRSAPELAAILGTSTDEAELTATSLERRRKTERTAGTPERWAAR